MSQGSMLGWTCFIRLGMLQPVFNKANQQRFVFNPTSAAGLLVFERLTERGGVDELMSLLDRAGADIRSGCASREQVETSLRRARHLLTVFADHLLRLVSSAALSELIAERRHHEHADLMGEIRGLTGLVVQVFPDLDPQAYQVIVEAQRYIGARESFVSRLLDEGGASRDFSLLDPEDYLTAARTAARAALAEVFARTVFGPPSPRADPSTVAEAVSDVRPRPLVRARPPRPPAGPPGLDPLIVVLQRAEKARAKRARHVDILLGSNSQSELENAIRAAGWPGAASTALLVWTRTPLTGGLRRTTVGVPPNDCSKGVGMKFAYMPDTHFGVYDQSPPSSEEAAVAFEHMLNEAVLAEELGFDAVFLPERHGRGETFVPSPLIAAAAIAARTSRIMIGTTILMPTLYNPMHLAEQVAMVDNLSRGRFVLGVGVGYHEGYHQTFGVPWERRGRRFEEAMEVLVKAFTEDRFSYHGEFFNFDDVQLTPKTYQRPRPPIWIGSHSPGKPLDRSLDYDGWVLWTQPDWDESEPWIASMRQRAAERGKTDWTVVIDQDGWIGSDPAAMRARHSPRWLREAQFYGEHDFEADIDPIGDIKKADEAELAIQDFETRQWHFGTPESWIERVTVIRDTLAPDYLNFRLRTPNAGYGPAHPTFDETLDAIRLFGEKVIPAFR